MLRHLRGGLGPTRSSRSFVRRVGRPASDSAGASALEFALIAPILLTLLFGIIEFGFAFQAQLAITHAAREGARIAAVNSWDPAVVEERAFPLTTTDGLSIALDTSSADRSVRVTVSYPYEWRLLPLGSGVVLSSRATMRKEF